MASVYEQEAQVQRSAVEGEWLTLKQMQEILSLGKTKCWELVATGQIEAVRIGRSVRVNRKSLEQFLASNTYTGTN
jgi:excisionase family DNA binding protein